MQSFSALKLPLKQYLNLHGARLSCLICIIFALMACRSVSYVRMSLCFIGKASSSSSERRISRFFKDCDIATESLIKLLAHLFNLKRIALALDRTQWSFGSCVYNLLTLSIIYRDIAFPVLIMPLGSKGNSSSEERIKLIVTLLSKLKCQIDYLVADREFIGEAWLHYLDELGLRYAIRFREDQLFPNQSGKKVKARALFTHLKAGECESRALSNGRYLTAARATNGHLWILISNVFEGPKCVDVYASRWKIEVSFGVLKSRGFDLESTHQNDPARLVRLIKVLTIAVAWAYLQGELRAHSKPIKIKKKRKAISTFRYGLDFITQKIAQGKQDSIVENITQWLQIGRAHV